MKAPYWTILALSALMIAPGATAAPFVNNPQLTVFPFAGTAAGRPALASPKFSVIDAPNGPYGGMMYVSELGANRVTMVNPLGVAQPFSVPAFNSGAAGLDIDGPVADELGATSGLYAGSMYAATLAGPVMSVAPNGAWGPFSNPANSGAGLHFDRTPGWLYGGDMFVSQWGATPADGITRVNPVGIGIPFVNLANRDPRYFTFDGRAGVSPYGVNRMWVSSYANGDVFAVTPGGAVNPPLATLGFGLEGLSFAPGDPWFGNDLYAANLNAGTIQIVKPNGQVALFAGGFTGAAYLQFVTAGPYAINGLPTLYVDDGNDSIFAIMPIPAPAGLGVLLGAPMLLAIRRRR